jgi:hypothetical protein
LQLEYQNFEGTSVQFKIAREENPYSQPNHAGIDKRFWSLSLFLLFICVFKQAKDHKNAMGGLAAF